MTPERWQQVKEIFHSALKYEPAERARFVSQACSGDETLQQEVESLIASHEKDGDFIGQSIAFEMQVGETAYLMEIASGGGTPTQLTFDQGKAYPHSWSPDGDKIAFAGQRNGICNIYWFSRRMKTQKQLTNYSKINAFVRYPAWSPLGNQIVFEYAEVTGNIWLMELKEP